MPAESRCSPHPPTLGTRKRVMNQEVRQAKAKRSVSAASVFKPRQVEKTWRASPAKLIAVSTGTGFSSPSVEQIYDPKSPSNAHGPAKTGVGGQKRGAENHPLAITFKETTNTYRDHLYITAATKIDASYNLLLRSLHNIDVNSFSDPHTLDSAPQPAERIKREMQYMSMPLGETILRFTRPLENGEKQQFEMKLSDRMALFEDRVQSQCEEVKALQRQWEEVVGEIWKCGVQILGKDIMDELLHSERRDERRNDSDLEGSTLFIPEQGDDEISWKSKSRGSFRDPIPEFLIQPSMMKGEDLSMPNIPMEQVKEMNKRIKSLGAVQIEELKKSHNDLENAYGKKVRQIQAICNADD